MAAVAGMAGMVGAGNPWRWFWVAAVGLPSAASSHCTEQIAPTVEIAYPRDGMSVETVCWPVFETCITDTFHREELLAELVAAHRASAHAAFLYADSLRNSEELDTVYYQGQVYFVDTVQVEDVWISVAAELKGSLPARQFRFKDRFIHIPGNPFATTYAALLDTPMLAFFDKADSLKHLGIGPLDGCFFEPTAYVIAEGRIRKKASDESARMPGVSVAVEDFFRAAGIAPVPVPPVRPRHVGMRRGRHGPGPGSGGAGFPGLWPRGKVWFDLRGRRCAPSG